MLQGPPKCWNPTTHYTASQPEDGSSKVPWSVCILGHNPEYIDLRRHDDYCFLPLGFRIVWQLLSCMCLLCLSLFCVNLGWWNEVQWSVQLNTAPTAALFCVNALRWAHCDSYRICLCPMQKPQDDSLFTYLIDIALQIVLATPWPLTAIM
jgi:hypothetical protein